MSQRVSAFVGVLVVASALRVAAVAGAAEREARAVVWAAADGAGRVELLWSPLGEWPAGGFRLERLTGEKSELVGERLRPLGDPRATAALAPELRAELEALARDLAAGGAPARRAAATAFLRGATTPAIGYAMGLRATDSAPGGSVRYRLSGQGGRGELLWQVETQALDSRRVTPAPDAPFDLAAEVEGETVRLRWTPPRGEGLAAFTFSVERRVGGETRSLTSAPRVPLHAKDDPRHGFDDSDPVPGADAVYRLTLHDILGRPSPPAEVAVRTPDFAALAPPIGLVATSEPGRIVLTWQPKEAAGTQGTLVERALLEQGPFTLLRSEPVPRASARYVDEGVADGTTYYYRLRSRAKDGASGEPSAVAWAEARGSTPPAPPEGLRAEAGRNRVRLAWQPASGPVSGYLVERETASGRWARLNAEYSAEPRFDDFIGPQDAAALRYRVSAVTHRGGLSAPSAVLAVRLPDSVPPPAPRLVGLRHGPAGVVLEFLPGAPAAATAAFRVLRGETPDGTALVLGPPLAATARSFSDPSARAGESYYYRLLAVDEAGNRSAPSEPMRATVPRPGVPAAPAPRVEARERPFAHVRVLAAEPPAGLTLVVERRVADEPGFVVLGTLARGEGAAGFLDAHPAAAKRAAYRVAYRDAAGGEGPPSPAVEIVAPRKE